MFTVEVLRKIEEVAALDGTIEEMAYYADIHVASIYRYFESHPDFSDRIAKLRERPVLKARQTIVRSLEDPKNAQWYIERKKKKEFSQRTETDVTTDGQPLASGQDVAELAKKFDDFFKEQNS